MLYASVTITFTIVGFHYG